MRISALMESPVMLAGDGRSDSPGFSAKYGSYTFLDLTTTAVVHLELVQVRTFL